MPFMTGLRLEMKREEVVAQLNAYAGRLAKSSDEYAAKAKEAKVTEKAGVVRNLAARGLALSEDDLRSLSPAAAAMEGQRLYGHQRAAFPSEGMADAARIFAEEAVSVRFLAEHLPQSPSFLFYGHEMHAMMALAAGSVQVSLFTAMRFKRGYTQGCPDFDGGALIGDVIG